MLLLSEVMWKLAFCSNYALCMSSVLIFCNIRGAFCCVYHCDFVSGFLKRM